MANTYTLIEAKTLTGNTASVEFTSIPQTYTDLKLVASARNTKDAVIFFSGLKFNGSSSNFTYKSLEGNGTTAYSTSGSASAALMANGPTSTSNTFSNVEIYIPNYTSSNYKFFSIDSVIENNATSGLQQLAAELWSNTAAITSITIFDNYYGAADFVQYSTFYLYGIKNS